MKDNRRSKISNSECPECGGDIKRGGSGIWECKRCEFKLAGGCYSPSTARGKETDRAIREAIEKE